MAKLTPTVIEERSAHYLDDKDGYRYEMLFYYDRPDLRAFSLEYNGTSPANIYISQLCFYALDSRIKNHEVSTTGSLCRGRLLRRPEHFGLPGAR
jgi:hypothetical protein